MVLMGYPVVPMEPHGTLMVPQGPPLPHGTTWVPHQINSTFGTFGYLPTFEYLVISIILDIWVISLHIWDIWLSPHMGEFAPQKHNPQTFLGAPWVTGVQHGVPLGIMESQ